MEKNALQMDPRQAKFSFVQNRECEFFPCHPTNDPDNFNCLFCYCPLYALGSKCGGKYKYLGGICKDCSDCLVPHGRGSYTYITSKFDELMELARQNKGGEEK